MPGFLGIINYSSEISDIEIPCENYTPVVCNEKRGQHYYFKRCVIPKFLNDKVFEESATTFIGTDGVIFNSRQLRERFGAHTNFALIEMIFSNQGINGISELKGNFSGFILDKKNDDLHIFTDHVGSKNIFWFLDEQRKILMFGSELKFVVSIMRKMGYIPHLSETGAYCLLTFGFMIGDNTLVKEIKKIPPGSALTFSKGEIKIDQYYKFTSAPEITDSEDTIIEELDSLFSEAIKLEYEKDLEYHYSHIATLSGGLDSRINVMKAKMLGYADILCLCFSQSNYLDETIAKKIASDQGFDFIFHTLDNGNYLKNIDEAVLANEGLTFFAGAAHMQFSIKLLDWTKYGLLHTGTLWFGPYITNTITPMNNESVKKISYSKKLLNDSFIQKLNILNRYKNFELLSLYEHGFNGLFNGYRVIEHFTEYSSPLHDKDFLAYALRIPQQNSDSLFLKWIQCKVPEAAEYLWEKTGVRIDAGPGKRFIYRLFRLLQAKFKGKYNKNTMNPVDYWYNTNPQLKEVFNNSYAANIHLLNKYPNLIKDAQKLFSEGTFIEKTQVLTLLAAIKLHSLHG